MVLQVLESPRAYVPVRLVQARMCKRTTTASVNVIPRLLSLLSLPT